MRHPLRLFALPLVAAALVVASACSDQAQGERCDTANGDMDCASGLKCTTLESLNVTGASNGAAICCPPAGTPATSSLCSPVVRLGDAGPGAGGAPSTADASPASTSADARTDH